VQTVEQVLDEGDAERAAEFFDRLNIPRSILLDEGTQPNSPLKKAVVKAETVADYTAEKEISYGIQKFLDRHERKIKWHSTHPSIEGVQNVLMLFRCASSLTQTRLGRLEVLLKKKDELNPVEWAIPRELMNRTYLTFRNYLNGMAGEWMEAMQGTVSRDELNAALGDFYQLVDDTVRSLEERRERLEERRQQLTVLPGDPFPPVKPPNYFGGHLRGKGPWKQVWMAVGNRAHTFREAVG